MMGENVIVSVLAVVAVRDEDIVDDVDAIKPFAYRVGDARWSLGMLEESCDSCGSSWWM